MKQILSGFLTLFAITSIVFGQQPGSIPAGNEPVSKESILPKISSHAQAAAASLPLTMSYQGLLTTGLGTPVADGSYDLQFDLYDSLSGGTSMWSETQTGVSVQRGTFNVILGSVTPLNIEFTRQLFVNVIATTGPAGPTYPLAFLPRATLASAPYSLAPWSTNGTSIYYNNGAVGIGTKNPSSVIPFLRLDIADEDGNVSDIATRVAGNLGGWPALNFAKSRGTLAAPAAIAMGEYPGQIVFKAFDGAFFRTSAYILAVMDSTTGLFDLPTALTFATAQNGSGSAFERMRITNAGNVGIGTNLPFFPLHVKKFEGTGTGLQARVSNTSTSVNSLAAFSLEANNGTVVSQAAVDGLGTGPLGAASGYYGTFTSHPIGFVTGNVERMRVTTAGNVGIGVTSPAEKLDVAGNIRLSGEVTYSSPKTGYISGTSWALGRALSSASSFTYSSGIYNNGASTAYYEVPVQLPDGVTLTQVNIYAFDADAANEITAIVLRQTHGSGSASSIGSLSSGVAFVGGGITLSIPVAEIVDNASYSYSFQLTMPATINEKYMDFRATYTYTTPAGVSSPVTVKSPGSPVTPASLPAESTVGGVRIQE